MRSIIGILGLLFAAAALAQDSVPNAQNGHALFKTSSCLSCHSVEAFTPKSKRLFSLTDLDDQVRSCDAKMDTHWFDDQIQDVVAHLNQEYYQFPPPK